MDLPEIKKTKPQNGWKSKRKESLSKRSRLIVRNLSFKTSEEDIKKVFAKFGNIVDINLPKKDDGKLKGFAFISFDNVASSLKAIKQLNGTKMFGRTIVVDFSVSKDLYTKLKAENAEQNKTALKQKKNINKKEITEETSEIEENDDDKEVDDKQSSDEELDDADDKEVDDKQSSDEELDDADDDNDEHKDNFTRKNKKYDDVIENKTVFIRNLGLETTEESLSELLSSFGSLEYCKICIDDYSEKSKGTAFAKFKNKDHAQKCIEEGQISENANLFIDGQQLNVALALPKNKLFEVQNANRNKNKDKRNLYLAKEGLIYPNSPASVGVSQSDLKKRLMFEERKRKLLQNYHYFISDKRLCIHNLPANVDDIKLKLLVLEAINDKNAQILWCKVMRNRSNADNKFGKSKGFGFVELNEHSYALKALRVLNNNPEMFTADRRPIVEFSVENMVALNRKKFRLIKQNKLNQSKENETSSKGSRFLTDSNEEQPSYSGVVTKPLDKNDKVVQPKMNRKMSQVKSDLKKRSFKLMSRKVRRENFEKHQIKLKKKRETKSNKKQYEEQEVFDSHYKKRKNIFISNKTEAPVAKVPKVSKTKWFMK